MPTFTGNRGATSTGPLDQGSTHDQGAQERPLSADITPSLAGPGPFNPASALPPKVVKKVLALEFVEMTELRADIWAEEPPPSEHGQPSRRGPAKPVTDIRIWLGCYARMASLLATRFPSKAPELWAYQSTILKAAHNYEGANWVAYDRQFRRDMLAKKDLNWSTPNIRLYNEAFTGRAKSVPRCPHCLCEDHGGTQCPHNPNPWVLSWGPDPRLPPPSWGLAPQSTATLPREGGSRAELCRNFNQNRCRFSRCRYQHICSGCFGPHPAVLCPRGSASGTHEPLPRSRVAAPARPGPLQPSQPRR
jgi:hypothetical protein